MRSKLPAPAVDSVKGARPRPHARQLGFAPTVRSFALKTAGKYHRPLSPMRNRGEAPSEARSGRSEKRRLKTFPFPAFPKGKAGSPQARNPVYANSCNGEAFLSFSVLVFFRSTTSSRLLERRLVFSVRHIASTDRALHRHTTALFECPEHVQHGRTTATEIRFGLHSRLYSSTGPSGS